MNDPRYNLKQKRAIAFYWIGLVLFVAAMGSLSYSPISTSPDAFPKPSASLGSASMIIGSEKIKFNAASNTGIYMMKHGKDGILFQFVADGRNVKTVILTGKDAKPFRKGFFYEK